MQAEIISVGHELLMGEIVDTNTPFIAQRLAEAGFAVRWTSQVGDDLRHLSEAFGRALRRSDVTVSTGGLGPTSDDLTREAVANALGEKTRVDPALLDWLKEVFNRRGIPMPETNIKQAALIPSARTVPNPLGTAPGWWVERDGRRIILLPGPPREVRRIWADTVGPALARLSGGVVVATRTLKTAGITEGGIDQMLGDMIGGANPYLGIYAKPDGIHLRVIARAATRDQADGMIAPIEERIRSILDGAIWGVDDETPATRAAELLRRRGMTLAAIEGASGGAIATHFSRLPRHPDAFMGSLVTGLREDGRATAIAATSLPADPTADAAKALAQAARQLLGADIGLGVTALADGVAWQPEGEYHIAVVGDGGARVVRGRASYAAAVTMQRSATRALVELISAVAAGAV